MQSAVYTQFNELERDLWWFIGMRRLCSDALEMIRHANGLRAHAVCADVGCGTGQWTVELGRFGQAVGIDLATEALNFCRARGVRRLLRARAEALPLASASCDVVTALGVIEHLDDDAGFVRELHRALRPRGHVLILTSAYRVLWSRHDDIVQHRRRYRRSELAQLLRAGGLEPVRLTYTNMVLLPAVVAVRAGRRLNPWNSENDSGSPDVFMPPPAVNRLLTGLVLAEAALIRHVPLPCGLGLFAVARRS